jgi:hypothetical protein
MVTIGIVRIELSLSDLEDSHRCLEADILRLKSASTAFRTTAERPSLQKPSAGANIRSGGKSARVVEGTAAESPDMNTIPDAGGGSVSSF